MERKWMKLFQNIENDIAKFRDELNRIPLLMQSQKQIILDDNMKRDPGKEILEVCMNNRAKLNEFQERRRNTRTQSKRKRKH
jgi:hypothetical protein